MGTQAPPTLAWHSLLPPHPICCHPSPRPPQYPIKNKPADCTAPKGHHLRPKCQHIRPAACLHLLAVPTLETFPHFLILDPWPGTNLRIVSSSIHQTVVVLGLQLQPSQCGTVHPPVWPIPSRQRQWVGVVQPACLQVLVCLVDSTPQMQAVMEDSNPLHGNESTPLGHLQAWAHTVAPYHVSIDLPTLISPSRQAVGLLMASFLAQLAPSTRMVILK